MNDLTRHAMLVFLGSGIGGAARFGVAEVLRTVAPHSTALFPWSTFGVNVLGCLAIGVLAPLLRNDLGLFLLTGVLGGFTTFSTFGRETVELWVSGRHAIACVYVLASMVIGIGAAAIGYSATALIHKPT